MYTDMFILIDSGGKELVRKKLIGHIKRFIDSQDTESLKYPLTVKSETSGYEFKVTKDTTVDEWRSFGDSCTLALD